MTDGLDRLSEALSFVRDDYRWEGVTWRLSLIGNFPLRLELHGRGWVKLRSWRFYFFLLLSRGAVLPICSSFTHRGRYMAGTYLNPRRFISVSSSFSGRRRQHYRGSCYHARIRKKSLVHLSPAGSLYHIQVTAKLQQEFHFFARFSGREQQQEPLIIKHQRRLTRRLHLIRMTITHPFQHVACKKHSPPSAKYN